MAKEAELEARFWKALKKDMTMMVGLTGVDETHSRPMTAQMEGDEGGPIWFFSSTQTELVQQVGSGAGSRALATFASKGHDLYAAVHGSLTIDNDRAVVDALWNPYVAAWYEGGKDDPKLVLLGSTPTAVRSGSTARACWPASRSCSATIPRTNTRTASPKSISPRPDARSPHGTR